MSESGSKRCGGGTQVRKLIINRCRNRPVDPIQRICTTMANPEASWLPANFWQKSCDDDPKFAFEQYVSMYHNCFKPATSPSPYGDGVSTYSHHECIRECHERLGKRTMNEVRAGAAKKRVDDMLEMGLRCVTTTHSTILLHVPSSILTRRQTLDRNPG